MAGNETTNAKTGEVMPNTGAEDNADDTALHAETGLVAQITRVEIDTAIATARAYPRSIVDARKEIIATIYSEDVAEECIYALPRANKHIRGPSIRFAEIAVAAWGNCESGARTTHIGEEFVEAEGVYRDYQRNVRKVRRVRRRITDSRGRRYNNDMILMTCNAACAIAERNAILSGIPKAIWSEAYEKAYAMVGGTIGTLDEKRTRALAALAALGVEKEKLFALLEIKGEAEITPDHVISLRGMVSALRTGEETIATIFNVRNMAGKDFEHVKDPLKDNNGGNGGRQGQSDTAQTQKAGDVQAEGVSTAQGRDGVQPQRNDQGADNNGQHSGGAGAATPQHGSASAAVSSTQGSQGSVADGPKTAREYIDKTGLPALAGMASASQVDDWWRRERKTRIDLKFTEDETHELEDAKDKRKDDIATAKK